MKSYARQYFKNKVQHNVYYAYIFKYFEYLTILYYICCCNKPSSGPLSSVEIISRLFCLSFALKAKAESHADMSSTKPQSAQLHALPSGSSPPSAQTPTAALANAVRIERLSDDEDVDITDDLSDDASQPEKQLDVRDEPKGSEQSEDIRAVSHTAFCTDILNSDASDVLETSDSPAEVVSEGNTSHFQTVTEPDPGETWNTKAQHEDESGEGTSCLSLLNLSLRRTSFH